MKKSSLILCALLSASAFASDLKVDLRDFNFSYQAPHGHGTAASFSRAGALEEAGVRLDVEKKGGTFDVKVSGAETADFVFKDAPGFVKDAKTMEVTDFDLAYVDSLSISLSRGEFVSTEDELSLQGLSLNCAKDSSHKEPMDQVVSGCAQNMRFRSSRFSSSSVEKNLLHAVGESILKAAGENSRGDLSVNNVDLKSVGGRYDLSADVRAQLSGKVKSTGTVAYDASTKVLAVRINEVKFGILGITGKVFEELKKQESANLQVKQPFVYLTVK